MHTRLSWEHICFHILVFTALIVITALNHGPRWLAVTMISLGCLTLVSELQTQDSARVTSSEFGITQFGTLVCIESYMTPCAR
jgi:hypothetical protein